MLPEAAVEVFDTLLEDILHLMIDCERFTNRWQRRLRLVAA